MEAKLTAQAERLARDLAGQAQTIDELNGLPRGLMKSAIECVLDKQMGAHLKSKGAPLPFEPPIPNNRKNGHSERAVRAELGEIKLDVPRDPDGSFEPKLLPKYQRRLAGFGEKILALYAKGLTTRDIQDVVLDLYGAEVSPSLISDVVAGLDEQLGAWRSRRLDAAWPAVFFDGIVAHVRGEGGRVSQHTPHVAPGVNLQGRKELLGPWLNQSEGAKFWLSCLTGLQSRGLKDVFVACVGGLTGFPEAIRAAYPEAKVRLCVVHLVRAALRHVTDEDSKEVVKGLKAVYQSATAREAELALDKFAEKWMANIRRSRSSGGNAGRT